MKRFFVLLPITIFAVACNGKKQPTVKREQKINHEWTTYAKDDYSIQYGYGWFLDTSDPTVDFFLHNINNTMPLMASNILLQEIPLQTETTIEEYAEEFKDNFNQAFPTGKFYSLEIMEYTNDIYCKMFYMYPKDGLNYKVENRSWIKNGKIYQLTFTNGETGFEKALPAAEAVMDTFWMEAKSHAGLSTPFSTP